MNVIQNENGFEIIDVCSSEAEASKQASAFLRRWNSGDPDAYVICYSTTDDTDSIEEFSDLQNKSKLWYLHGNEV